MKMKVEISYSKRQEPKRVTTYKLTRAELKSEVYNWAKNTKPEDPFWATINLCLRQLELPRWRVFEVVVNEPLKSKEAV